MKDIMLMKSKGKHLTSDSANCLTQIERNQVKMHKLDNYYVLFFAFITTMYNIRMLVTGVLFFQVN